MLPCEIVMSYFIIQIQRNFLKGLLTYVLSETFTEQMQIMFKPNKRPPGPPKVRGSLEQDT